LAELRHTALAPEAAGDARDARALPPALRGIRAAFVFLSRVPLGGFPYRASDWAWAPAHFPLVGAAVGGASALIYWLAGALSFGRLLGASLAVVMSVWITGAFHEDGLADSADGLGGSHGDRQRALEIMKDSRIGTYGATALILSVLVRVLAIAELDPGAWFACVYVHAVARVGPVWLMGTQAYVSDPAASKSPPSFHTRRVHLATATAWGALFTALAMHTGEWRWLTPLAVTAALVLVTTLCARAFRRAVGGVTGDLLGAAEQVSEVAAWLALLAALRF
jgi:adenosylcobinamide-GDP ribazoletransferase